MVILLVQGDESEILFESLSDSHVLNGLIIS
jgi:hypothetical protein